MRDPIPHEWKTFLSLCRCRKVTYIIEMKVFRFYPWIGISQIHVSTGISKDRSSLALSYTAPKYITAGVGYCLFVQRLCENLYPDKRTTPHFLCFI